MLYRCKQFVSAITATLTPADRELIKSVLSKQEQPLFFAMDIVDQRHCLDVAKTCKELIKQGQTDLNQGLLLKAALLHDVGKPAGSLKIWDRVIIVILQKYRPQRLERLANRPGTPYHTALFHPQAGGKLCAAAGCDPELVQLITRHHAPLAA
ncbi:MAG TPA: HDIG domain-containing protein, partial [Verrucomicrobiae bacterium]|nr:HDIG domain-containing protein [Verrucomicrobiae bacterium]